MYSITHVYLLEATTAQETGIKLKRFRYFMKQFLSVIATIVNAAPPPSLYPQVPLDLFAQWHYGDFFCGSAEVDSFRGTCEEPCLFPSRKVGIEVAPQICHVFFLDFLENIVQIC